MTNEERSSGDPTISVPAKIGNVPAVTEFVENTAGAMGLGAREAMALTLASEEIFAYLCKAGSYDRDIDVTCSNGSYYVRLDFLFGDKGIDIGAFNITSKVSPDDEASLAEMGLLIAARSVDRFCYRQKTGSLSKLSLTCDKQYESCGSRGSVFAEGCAATGNSRPEDDISSPPVSRHSRRRRRIEGEDLPAMLRIALQAGQGEGALSKYTIVSPCKTAIETFAKQVWGLSSLSSPLGGEDQGEGAICNTNPTMSIPVFFEFPGKVVDMVCSGEFAVGVAQGAQGEIGGGIVWSRSDSKTVECFGPYLFGQLEDSQMASALVDFCLADIARTSAVGLLNRYPASLPVGYFESLGAREIRGADGSISTVKVSFRQTKDDPGCTVTTDPGIEPFLREKYVEFAFPREVITDWDRPDITADRSVLSTDLNRKAGQATLYPVLAGRDNADNVADHLALLQSENVGNIVFEIDLGAPWQSSFIPALLANSFKPMVLLPYAGKGDIVVFQLDKSEL